MASEGKSDNEKLLDLMRFWLFGTFVIVFTAITTFMFLFTSQIDRNPLQAVIVGAPIWILTAVLSVVIYYGYKWYLGRSS